MRLLDRVYLVGSGALGLGLTDHYDCQVYLIDGGDELALVDAGGGRQPERILAQIRVAGFRPEQVRQLLLTHGHADHAGGAAALRRATGARVYAPRAIAPAIQAGDEEAISLSAARAAGVYPADYRFHPCPVDHQVGTGDVITVGDLVVTVLETPGHAHAHVSYVFTSSGRRHLLAGDTVFCNGQIALLSTPDSSLQEYRDTVLQLADLEVDALLPGHWTPILNNGSAHIAIAADAFRRLGVPRNALHHMTG